MSLKEMEQELAELRELKRRADNIEHRQDPEKAIGEISCILSDYLARHIAYAEEQVAIERAR